ncbi:MAG TPA: asparagine synthase (glutamine-hydrolyzing) [Methylibium sp.]|uniref:asparagine synthase (glutamine-hydrolyzing) n=1 Tax=Methylibium sp. TaxID=2067992 RepID=UPI002DBB6A08|nr:asparagine synthase (glutamine-hydrolyzing) [Methylibium sp.]HEU4459532.1 asparagine synthase (glutamine-hydrolyzing) [Methylibium sp.]
MCGIAGIHAYRDGAAPVDGDELARIDERLRSRGPDGHARWRNADGRIAFAHRRLAIIDLSEGGAQPMHHAASGHTIVFNGEIYNHQALRRELHDGGASLRSSSDTEVLLRLFVERGPSMLVLLRGMYALAIWSERERRLFLARDPLGIKPLYIADDGATLRFASQVKALLAGRVDAAPDAAGHAGFMLWGSVPEPYTLHRGIRAVPAGHGIEVRDGRVAAPVAFASPRETLAQGRVAGASAGEAEDALRANAEAVRSSVRAHMVADVPVGVFLSAGLDSTMIAAAASAAGELRTVTLGFDEYAGTPDDEAPLASEAARSLGARHQLCRIGAADFAADRDAILAAMDQPSIDGVNVWFVAKAAARQGLKVALSGLGGDELLGSYPSFEQVPRLHRALRGFGAFRGAGRLLRRAAAPACAALTSPKYAGLLEYGSSMAGAYMLRRCLHMPWELPGLIGDAMARDGLQALATEPTLAASIEGIASERLQVSALEMQWYMRHQLLRDADWAGMAHSLEIRTPLADMELLSNIVALPQLGRANEKRAVARAVAPALPAAILERPKTGFSIPTQRWLTAGLSARLGNHRQWAGYVYRHFTGAAA